RFLSLIAIGSSVAFVGFAVSPNIVFAVGFNCIINASLALLGPGIYVAFSLAIPARARATGFTPGSGLAIPGFLALPFIGWVADQWNIRVGMLVMVPLFIIGGLILRSTADLIDDDIAQVWRATAARSEALYQRRHGEADLLLVRGVDAG